MKINHPSLVIIGAALLLTNCGDDTQNLTNLEETQRLAAAIVSPIECHSPAPKTFTYTPSGGGISEFSLNPFADTAESNAKEDAIGDAKNSAKIDAKDDDDLKCRPEDRCVEVSRQYSDDGGSDWEIINEGTATGDGGTADSEWIDACTDQANLPAGRQCRLPSEFHYDAGYCNIVGTVVITVTVKCANREQPL